jgi:UDP-4-amino-4-deoxy-L-arabinose-oxoglutarate aminotransferase
MIMLGWKYNMDNIQAAILIPQLGRINEKLEKRELIARRYDLMLEKLKHYIEIPSLPTSTIHARHIYPIWFKNICRDTMIKKLAEKQIPSVVNYQAIHTLSFFKENLGYKKEDFPIAQNIGDSTLSLPFYPNMPIKNIEFIVNKIEEVINELSNQ